MYWDTVVSYIRDTPDFDFTNEGMAAFMSLVRPELTSRNAENGTVVDTRTFSVLSGLNNILPVSLSMMTFLGNEGPAYVKANFHLVNYLLGTQASFSIGLNFIRLLVENVVGFGDWGTYVETTAQNVAKLHRILIQFKTFAPTQRPLDKINIEGRHLFLQSQEVIKQTKTHKRSGSTSLPGKIDTSRPAEFSAPPGAGGLPSTFVGVEPLPTPGGEELPTAVVSDNTITFDFSKPVEQAFTDAIDHVFETLKTHKVQRQQELLDGAETLALSAVRRAKKRMLATGGGGAKGEEYEKAKKAFDEAQNRLTKIHEELRKANRERLATRHQFLESKLAEFPESQARYQEQKLLQEDVILYLEDLYTGFSKATPFLDVSEHLAALNGIISSLYNVSISVVISGLMSVGKSTVVNCLVGRNLSPYRDEAMTSIPTRYVHDPEQEDPHLLVPFNGEINAVLQLVRERIKADGIDVLKKSVKVNTLMNLLDKINGGLQINREYLGEGAIMDATLNLNDIYRLSAQAIFGAELISELPLDWSKSLGDYLTVSVRFPGISPELGLVEFSVIDTPGIDEDNVQRLNLKKVLMDALEVCNYAALVTTPRGYQALAMAELKQMFHAAVTRWKVPVLAFVTMADASTDSDLATIPVNISNNIRFDPQVPIFQPTEVFTVSARRKHISQRMSEFLAKKGYKPERTSEDLTEREVAKDWINFVSSGFDLEEKTDSYNNTAMERIKERCTKLGAASKMDAPIGHIMNTLSKNAIPIAARPALLRADEHVKALQEQLSASITVQNRQRAVDAAAKLTGQLESQRHSLKTALAEEGAKLKRQFTDQINKATLVVEKLNSIPLPKDSPNLGLSSFQDHLIFFVKNLEAQNRSAAELLTSTAAEVIFPTAADVPNAVAQLNQCVSRAMEGYLTMVNTGVPKTLSNAAQRHCKAIQDTLSEIAAVYRDNLKVTVPDIKQFTEKTIVVQQEPVVFDISFAIKKVAQKKTGLLGQFKDLKKQFTGKKEQEVAVSVMEVRKALAQYTKKLGEQWQDILEKKVAELSANLMEVFSSDLDKVIAKIRDTAEGMFVVQSSDVQQQANGKAALAAEFNKKLGSNERRSINARLETH